MTGVNSDAVPCATVERDTMMRTCHSAAAKVKPSVKPSSGKNVVQCFLDQYPKILPDVKNKVQAIKTKVFNERQKLRNKNKN
ncbi:uncharacterized protein LOC117117858 isoform X3 [Anneissia japonica]|uniref:uncharacterized protein LOC117117858 isoform X3 n=1 Tax=Anneissia japonica TaxID=1529436 RepID=UPI0014255FA5|nr:uncharacterized protein LOC117117858 isoform X3 [Anneissia japonica]